MEKLCKKCNTMKPLSDFHKKAGRKDGHASTCKECVNDRVRTYDPDKNRDAKLRKTYGISLKEYQEMLKAQGGKCAICGGSEPINGRLMAVDHCHTTGKVRGILCSHCNRALGFFRDNVQSLENAIRYLKGGE